MYEYEQGCKKALSDLLAFFNGNKTQMADTIGVSRNAVARWFRNGRIGRKGAMAIGKNKKIPFTKEDLRPDIKYWDNYRPL